MTGTPPIVPRGNPLERLDDFLDVRRRLGLRGGHDDVFASLAAPPAFVEQLERLADAAGVAEEDLQLAPLFGSLGCFDLTKQRLRVAGTRAIVARQHS